MNWKDYIKPFAVKFAGQALLATAAWYWLGLGVGTKWMVAANGALALGLVLAWSVLDAYGLGAVKNGMWAVPVVALTPLMGYHVGFAILVPVLWLVLLFPSAAAGKWKLMLGPGYLAVCAGILLVMAVVPVAVVNWIPNVDGLRMQMASFGLRGLFAYAVFVAAWTALLLYIGKHSAKANSV